MKAISLLFARMWIWESEGKQFDLHFKDTVRMFFVLPSSYAMNVSLNVNAENDHAQVIVNLYTTVRKRALLTTSYAWCTCQKAGSKTKTQSKIFRSMTVGVTASEMEQCTFGNALQILPITLLSSSPQAAYRMCILSWTASHYLERRNAFATAADRAASQTGRVSQEQGRRPSRCARWALHKARTKSAVVSELLPCPRREGLRAVESRTVWRQCFSCLEVRRREQVANGEYVSVPGNFF
jgi:hypothetical protein